MNLPNDDSVGSGVVSKYREFLKAAGYSIPTVKNYLADLRRFLTWTSDHLPEFSLSQLSEGNLRDYHSYLQAELREKPAILPRRLSSLRNFLTWAGEQGFIPATLALPKELPIQPTVIPSKETPEVKPTPPAPERLHQKVIHHIRFSRPAWYKNWHAHPASRPVHLSILGVVTILAAALFVYQWFIVPARDESNKRFEELGNVLAAATPPRILSFQGRLTNGSGTPIDEVTSMVFRIYTSTSGDTGSPCANTCKWESATRSVDPDQNGIFSVILGDTGAGDPAIPSTLFSENAELYLGVKVVGDDEMTPRQRIAAVSYALNSDALEGFHGSQSPGANQVTILDGSGNLMFASAVTIGTPTTSAITLDSGTTGAVNIGNNANAKVITIGNETGATSVEIDSGTGAISIGNAIAKTINIGNATGATLVNIDSGTGGVTVDSTGTGDIVVNSTDTLLLDSAGVLELNSSAGVISIGNDAVAQNINIGTGAAARTITIGNSTTTTSLVLTKGASGEITFTGYTTCTALETDADGHLNCGTDDGGALTPWTSDIDADGYNLTSLSNLLFQETTGAPAGTDVGLFRDNSGDLNLNVLTGKTFNVQVNGGDEYNFSSTALAFNSNNITGLGTTLSAAGALTISSDTTNAITLDSGTSGTVNIGNNANAKVITIGNETGATSLELDSGTGAISIGNAIAKTINIGNATGATLVNIDSGTGGVTIDSTGTGDILLNSTDTLLLDSAGVLELNSSAGVISIGNDAVAQNINIGTGAAARAITLGNETGATSVEIDSGTGAISIGNAVAKTINIGNATGATLVNIDSGTGGVTIDSTSTGDILLNSTDTLLLDSAGVLELNSSAGIISIGNDAVAQNINIGTGAAARAIALGNTGVATTFTFNSGATTQTALSLATASLTIGEALDITAASSPTGGGTQSIIDFNFTNSPSGTANTLRGLDISLVDAVALGNTNYGLYTAVNNTAANSTDTTKNIYGSYISAAGSGSLLTGAANIYGQFISASGSVAGTGSVLTVGSFISLSGLNTTGASTAYGLYITGVTGADYNYPIYQSDSTGTNVFNTDTDFNKHIAVGDVGAIQTDSAIYVNENETGTANAELNHFYGQFAPGAGSTATYRNIYSCSYVNNMSATGALTLYGIDSYMLNYTNMGAFTASEVSAFHGNLNHYLGGLNLTITDSAVFHADAIATTGSGGTRAVTNQYGLWIENQGFSGATNAYGIKIDDITAGTNRYPIYQAGATGTNVFGAPLVPLNAPSASTPPGPYNLVEVGYTGNQGLASAIGTDGFPVVGYGNNSDGHVRITHCGDASCSSGNLTTIVGNSDMGQDPSIAIGSDGFPVMSYVNTSANTLRVVKCANTSCSSFFGPYTVDSDASIDLRWSSIAIGSDTYPIISYYLSTTLKVAHCTTTSCDAVYNIYVLDAATAAIAQAGTSIAIGPAADGYKPIISFYDSGLDLAVIHCGDTTCSSGNVTSTIDSTDSVGSWSSMAIATDGYPIIAYYNLTYTDLKVAKCTNSTCSAGTSTLTTVSSANDIGKWATLVIGGDGLPWIAYFDETSDQIFAIKCNNTSCPSVGKLLVSSATANYRKVGLAIGSDGLPGIAYHDGVSPFYPKFFKCGTQDCSATNYTGGVDLGSSTSYWEDVYAARFWGKSFQITAFDIAEAYKVTDGSIGAGDLVTLSPAGGLLVEKSAGVPYDSKVVGVISTDPGIKLSEWEETADTRHVALAGRVPVKVSTENGAIAPGDPLTSSSTPGVAMKATQSGPIVGKALESFSCSQSTDYGPQPDGNQAVDGGQSAVDSCYGKIMVFVSVGWYVAPLGNGEQQMANSSASISTNSLSIGDYKLAIDADNNLSATIPAGSKFVFKDPAGQALAWVSSLGEAFFEKVTALVGDFGKLVFGELVASKDSQVAGQASFEPDQTEVFIESEKVTESSLIYITPTTKLQGLNPYIKDKKPGEGFVVGLERSVGDLPDQATASAATAIKFNWLIINQE